MYSLCLFARVLLGVLLMQSCRASRKWDYEPISLKTFTSDPSQLKIEAKIVRIRRGDFAISANCEWKYTTDESTMVEAYVYRSSSGDEADYKLLPWAIPKQPFYDYLDHYYKDVVMRTLSHCSNIPQIKGKFQPPWPVQTYVIDKCVLGEGDGLPEIAPPGFYKLTFNFSGTDQPTWGFTLVLKVTTKLW
ncbi:uncharacterized protein [Drosophila kikkawai]|uniref:Uncharacterized protein n=1 Tax=Drosophila kikkawai TaxID=30033 RepID=A0A6P4INL8_DROKI